MTLEDSQKMLIEGDQLADRLVTYAQVRGLCSRDLLVALTVAECVLSRGHDAVEGCSDSARTAAAEGLALFRTTQFTRYEN